MEDTQLDAIIALEEFNDSLNTDLDLLFQLKSVYTALQYGMDVHGVDDELRRMVVAHNSSNLSLEEFFTTHPAEQFKSFIETTPYGFALEGLDVILDWNVWGQCFFICFCPMGIVIWCCAIAERIYRDIKLMNEAREQLKSQGFYEPGANPADFGSEALDEKTLPKYRKCSFKGYNAKLLLEELEASYNLMRIFTDSVQNNTQVKPRQIIPSLKKLGFIVDEARGKIHRDPNKKAVKGTMEELGYGDPNFIKQLFLKTSPHTDLMPAFISAMRKIEAQQKDQNGVLAKMKRFFHIGSKEEVKPQDKISGNLVIAALKSTLIETEALFKQSLALMAVIHKFD